MDNNSILKYLQGKASEKEKELFFRWLEESPEHKEEFSAVKKIWALSAKYKNTEGTIWADLKPVTQPEKKTHKHFIRILKQAAIFIILVGCGALAQFYISQKADNNQTVYADSFSVKAPLGQMTNLELPDGTLVMLNSGTTITYSGDFTSGNRQVYLQGEAFFDVQKDVDHPFIVNSEFLGVKVYGTSFNIQAYPEDRTFAATLVEGSIGLLDANGEEVTKLVPGEKACFDESGTNIEIKQVDTAMYTSWKEGLVTYRNERLEDIAKQIERWYNVEIVIQKEGLGDERYFGTILKNKPIDQILEVLKLTTSLQYEIVPRANKPSLIYWK